MGWEDMGGALEGSHKSDPSVLGAALDMPDVCLGVGNATRTEGF